jgi:hypothetical protein
MLNLVETLPGTASDSVWNIDVQKNTKAVN